MDVELMLIKGDFYPFYNQASKFFFDNQIPQSLRITLVPLLNLWTEHTNNH